MRLAAFESMVQDLSREIPEEFLAGIAEITVSPRVIPHPDRPGIYTLGECVPLPTTVESGLITSRVILYHGSFAALAEDDPDFDWEGEAWETLTHEVRHHVEWRAGVDSLGATDDAVEENFARLDGDRFDPLFYRDGEVVSEGVFRIEDDYFVEVERRRISGSEATFQWKGVSYRATLPSDLGPIAFLSVPSLADGPGEVILVVRSRRGWISGSGRIDRREIEVEPDPGQ